MYTQPPTYQKAWLSHLCREKLHLKIDYAPRAYIYFLAVVPTLCRLCLMVTIFELPPIETAHDFSCRLIIGQIAEHVLLCAFYTPIKMARLPPN